MQRITYEMKFFCRWRNAFLSLDSLTNRASFHPYKTILEKKADVHVGRYFVEIFFSIVHF